MSDSPETTEKKKNNTTLIIVIVAVAVLLLLCACAAILGAGAIGAARWFRTGPVRVPEVLRFGRVESRRTFERTFDDIETPLSIVVENQVGEVRVVGTDAQRVVVRATARAYGGTQAEAQNNLDRIQISAEQSGSSRIVVRGEYPRVISAGRSPTVAFDIEVPVQSSVDVTTNVGEIHISNLEGQGRLRTGVGEVTVRGYRGALDVNTNVGEIDVYTWTIFDDSQLITGVGEIQVRLVGDPSFNLMAKTNVGDINSAFPVDGERTRELGPGDSLQGVVGDSPTFGLTLRTNTGGITISRAR